jgi:hypothetical protein
MLFGVIKKEQLNSIQVTEEFPKLLKQLNLKMELYLVKNSYILDNGKPWILGVPEVTSRTEYDERELFFNKSISRNNK